ncbi:MAG: hypothetical protein ACFFEW_02580 [Candidatus Thorarchaeota archaeon]
MTNDPMIIIEEYLALVNEHLPESISEDVINELRSYMIETATELGDGEITHQSAKKVVAKFGAPSEVAYEYKHSMLPDQYPSDDIEKESEKEFTDRVRESISYSDTFFQALGILTLWAFLICLCSTLIGPIWISTDSSTILIIQLTIVLGGLMVIIRVRKGEGIHLWKRSYPEWSPIQRLLTIPENLIHHPSTLLFVLDTLGSIIGALIFLQLTLSYASPWFMILIAIPGCVAFTAKGWIGIKRRRSLDPTLLKDWDVIAVFSTLLILDSSILWVRTGIFVHLYLWTLIQPFTAIWGAVLFFQLVTRGQNLYWIRQDTESTPTQEDINKLIDEAKESLKSTVARIIGWSLAFSVWPIYSNWLSSGMQGLLHSNSSLSQLIWFGPLFFIPVLVYFLLRIALITIRKVNTVIGKRSRIEAFIDLGLSVYLLYGLIMFSQYLFTPVYVDNMMLIARDLGFYIGQMYGIGLISFHFLLMIALVLRIIGNLYEFKESRRKIGSELIVASGGVLIASISLMVGVDFLSPNYISLQPSMFYIALFIVVTVAFQIETTKQKLRLQAIQESSDTSPSQSREIGVQIGSNYPEQM